MMPVRSLLWVDCIAGALVGVMALALSGWLSTLGGLPRGLYLATGAANLLYGAYSFSLAVRVRRSMTGIVALVAANASWAVVCVILAVTFWDGATVLGRAHLVLEGVFVGRLAALEWRWRAQLLAAGHRRDRSG